jgi:hypothetical protein
MGWLSGAAAFRGDASVARRVGLCFLAVALVGLLAAGSAPAKSSASLLLVVTVRGSGSVRAEGRSFSCAAKSCRHTFRILRERTVVVRASPHKGWKLTKWAGPCGRVAGVCSLRLKSRRSVAVGFVFVAPGDRLNPYPLGRTATVVEVGGEDWRLKVDSATINANTQVDAVLDPLTGQPANQPPPIGAQYSLVNLSLTSLGGGSSLLGDVGGVLSRIETEGRWNIAYKPDSCAPPPPDLGTVRSVFFGRTEIGNLCFAIGSNDAGTLQLRALGRGGRTSWFALR